MRRSDWLPATRAAGLSLAALVLLRPRISWYGYAAVVLLITTLLLTRHPLEMSQSITRMVSAHSFIYNRFAFAGLVVTGLFVALPDARGRREALLGLGAGALAALVCLTKPTFVILAPGLLLACMVQRRWHAASGVLVGLCGTLLLVDPGFARLSGSFAYAMAHVGGQNDPADLIRKAIQIPFAQPVAVTFALAALVCMLRAGGSWAKGSLRI